LGHKLVERTLLIFVKEQSIDRRDRCFVTSNQASHILAEMFLLLGGLKHRGKVT
jgi:hypothetical protein